MNYPVCQNNPRPRGSTYTKPGCWLITRNVSFLIPLVPKSHGKHGRRGKYSKYYYEALHEMLKHAISNIRLLCKDK